MELKELKESVRRNLVKTDLRILDILATGHNLIGCIESKNWERLSKKTYNFINSYNKLIEELNRKETPIEDEIIKLEEKIEELNRCSKIDVDEEAKEIMDMTKIDPKIMQAPYTI